MDGLAAPSSVPCTGRRPAAIGPEMRSAAPEPTPPAPTGRTCGSAGLSLARSRAGHRPEPRRRRDSRAGLHLPGFVPPTKRAPRGGNPDAPGTRRPAARLRPLHGAGAVGRKSPVLCSNGHCSSRDREIVGRLALGASWKLCIALRLCVYERHLDQLLALSELSGRVLR